MIKNILIALFAVIGLTLSAQESFTITNSGFQFNPSLVTVKIGDNINFSVGTNHPVRQVSEATYNSNGNTALPGGFSFPSGSGTFTATQAGTIYYVCANHVGSGMKGKIEVTQVTAKKDISVVSGFDIYPNPVSDILYFKNPGQEIPKTTAIFDISGKKVLQSEIHDTESKNSILVEDLKKGLYIISVTYSGKSYTRRFIKL